jgi:septum site-determining protein MinC
MLEIINEETNLSITFVEDLTGELPVSGSEGDPADIADDSSKSDGAVYFHQGNLRGGQAISQTGSVVVLGDVNAGAQIVATGNVVVFGVMRGFVHAGSEGDENAFVAALLMQPIQLRIADKTAHFPQERLSDRNRIDPAYAFISDGKIQAVLVSRD